MPMEKFVITPRGKQAEAWLRQALADTIDGRDPLIAIGIAEAALRIDCGELSADELDIDEMPDEEY